MAKKAAAVAESIAEDTELTPEEKAELEGEEKGEERVAAEAPEAAEKPSKEKPHEEAVPYDRFREQGEELKSIKQQLAEANAYRERFARLEERQKVAQERQDAERAQQQAAEQAKLRPDPDIDPAGARAWDAEQRALAAEQRTLQLQEQLQGVGARLDSDRETQAYQNWLAMEVPRARATVPDYDQRVDFAREARIKYWSKLLPVEQAREVTGREEILITNLARQRGIPLHELVGDLSNTWGYAAPQQNGAPAARPAAPAAAGKITRLQNGQAVQGLGHTATGTGAGPKDWQTMSEQEFTQFIVNMTDEDYMDRLEDKAFAKKVREIGME